MKRNKLQVCACLALACTLLTGCAQQDYIEGEASDLVNHIVEYWDVELADKTSKLELQENDNDVILSEFDTKYVSQVDREAATDLDLDGPTNAGIKEDGEDEQTASTSTESTVVDNALIYIIPTDYPTKYTAFQPYTKANYQTIMENKYIKKSVGSGTLKSWATAIFEKVVNGTALTKDQEDAYDILKNNGTTRMDYIHQSSTRTVGSTEMNCYEYNFRVAKSLANDLKDEGLTVIVAKDTADDVSGLKTDAGYMCDAIKHKADLVLFIGCDTSTDKTGYYVRYSNNYSKNNSACTQFRLGHAKKLVDTMNKATGEKPRSTFAKNDGTVGMKDCCGLNWAGTTYLALEVVMGSWSNKSDPIFTEDGYNRKLENAIVSYCTEHIDASFGGSKH